MTWIGGHFALLILTCSLYEKVSSIEPYRSSATFYESTDRSGPNLKLTDASDGSRFQEALAKRQTPINPTQLCATGVWLLYEHGGFRTSMDDTVQLLSGKDNCANVNISAIGSVQRATPDKFTEGGSIALFTNKNFGSQSVAVSEEKSREGGVWQLQSEFSTIGSILVVGRNSWSLMSTKGKVICVRPQPVDSDSIPVCVGINLLKVHIEGFEANAVYPECPPEHDESIVANIRLVDCWKFVTDELQPLKPAGQMGRGFGNDEETTSLECHRPNIKLNTSKFSEEEQVLINKLINIRLYHDFDKVEQTLWPDAKEDLWKAVPIDTAYDIAITTIPSIIADPQYLKIMREFTMFHLNEVWKIRGNASNNVKEWKQHRKLVHLLNECLGAVTQSPDDFQSVLKSNYFLESTPKEFTQQIHEDFAVDISRDPVIEMAWLVSNYALILCHQAYRYQYNFWDNFISTFENLYFIPLKDRWVNPSPLTPSAFRAILSGFGTESQYKRVGFAASVFLARTPNLRPFEKSFVQKLGRKELEPEAETTTL